MVGLILIACLAFFHAATRTLKTYTYWANLATGFEAKLTRVNEENERLRTADREHPLDDKTIGVDRLRIDLGRALANRGRVWADWGKQKAVTLPSGIMEITVSNNVPSPDITPNMLLYAFEEGDGQSPGKYLGEFHVKGVHQNQMQMDSTGQLASGLAKNVTDSKGPWILYEMIPTDEKEAFEGLSEDDKKVIPAELLKPDRLLEDYLATFRACEVHRTLMADRQESTRRDLSYLEAADTEVKSQEAAVEKEKTQVLNEKQRADKELAAMSGLYAAVQRMLGFNQTAVQTAIAKNVEYAQEIAKRQKEAADLIDRRTRNLAQYGPGAN